MSEESLLSTARRVSRNFRIDMEKGGIITVETLAAMDAMDREISREHQKQKSDGAFELTADEKAQLERWLRK